MPSVKWNWCIGRPSLIAQHHIAAAVIEHDLKVLFFPNVFAERDQRRRPLLRRPGGGSPAYPLNLDLCPTFVKAGHIRVVDAALKPVVMAPNTIGVKAHILDPGIPIYTNVLTRRPGVILLVVIPCRTVICTARRIAGAIQPPVVHVDC